MVGALRRGRLILSAAATALAMTCTLAESPAIAGPTVWSRAREPKRSVDEDLVRDAQRAVMRYRRMLRNNGQPSLAALVRRDARASLEKVVSGGGADFGVRLLYVEVLRDGNDNDEAYAVLTKLLKDGPPAPIRAEALGELAILHAIAGRREEEIRAYTDALGIEPHAHRRCRLLANRAEALMAMGDVSSAVEGYRAALAPLTNLELYFYAPTALFGMGVALDRTGNLEEGLQSIKLARAYDPIDRGLRSPDWFFSPSHDAHWYWALGGWSAARSAESWAARAEGYYLSVFEWEEYIRTAPADDRWIPLARVRLAQVQREQEQLKKRFEAQKKAGEDKAAPSFDRTVR